MGIPKMSTPATPWPAHIRGCPSLLDGYKVEDTEVILGVPRNNPMALINFSFVLLALLPLAFQARACDDVHAWGQCGGIGYTGSTTCASGLICQEWNPWYSQCIPAPTTSTSSIRSTTFVSTISS
ncbi:hypothetical protein FRC18_009971, partial [Serendipita sp. 400]